MMITFSTEKNKQVLDITNEINREISANHFTAGLCHMFLKHTTAALTTADLDAGGTDLDYLDAFSALMPKLDYRHPHNPPHVVDHILSSIIGSDVTIPIADGKLDLGAWQRVVLIELDGPRDREIAVNFIKVR
jgi:secondary thiamine-phosphate synthase enzyme